MQKYAEGHGSGSFEAQHDVVLDKSPALIGSCYSSVGPRGRSVARVLPNIGEAQVQASGNLLGTESFQSVGRIPVLIDVLDDLSEYELPTGSRAQVAVYSDHVRHIAIMRKILLRAASWKNYLYLDH